MAQPDQVHASLFVTCIVDQLYPQVGVSAVRVLRRQGVVVDFPEDQTCCGQPLFNSGFTRLARQLAERVLNSFTLSQYVVVPSGSCAAMLKVFYRDLFAGDPVLAEKADQLSRKVYEFSEFLVKVLGVTDVGARSSANAAYHSGCHLLREMEVREEPLQLLERWKGSGCPPCPRQRPAVALEAPFPSSIPTFPRG